MDVSNIDLQKLLMNSPSQLLFIYVSQLFHRLFFLLKPKIDLAWGLSGGLSSFGTNGMFWFAINCCTKILWPWNIHIYNTLLRHLPNKIMDTFPKLKVVRHSRKAYWQELFTCAKIKPTDGNNQWVWLLYVDNK